MTVEIRPAVAGDIEACGRIIFEAFGDIAERHRFPADFPTIEDALQLATMFVGHPAIWGVVAESGGRVVGCNFLDQRDAIHGLGPIVVDPRVQARGIGRRLMRAVLDRGRESGSTGIRLLQDSFNVRSVALYASLGFDMREPALLLTGGPAGAPIAGVEVRAMTGADLDACAKLCERVHGFDRRNDLADAVQFFGAMVALRGESVVAYASAPTFWALNHGVAETEGDLRALLLGAAALTPEPLGLLLPARQAELLRWCLGEGLRVVKPMTLMTMGAYHEPKGAYFTSVLY